MLPFQKRFLALTLSVIASLVLLGLIALLPGWHGGLLALLAIPGSLALLGLWDLFQTRHAVLRNYPIMAHLRFLLEDIRPEIRQYFFEDEKSGMPFPRDKRAIVYLRANVDRIASDARARAIAADERVRYVLVGERTFADGDPPEALTRLASAAGVHEVFRSGPVRVYEITAVDG